MRQFHINTQTVGVSGVWARRQGILAVEIAYALIPAPCDICRGADILGRVSHHEPRCLFTAGQERQQNVGETELHDCMNEAHL